jgi:protease-4
MKPAEEFIQTRLADTLIYKTSVSTYLKQLTHTDMSSNIHTLSVDDMTRIKQNTLSNKKDVIAVYYAEGDIVDNATTTPLGATEEGIVGNKMCKDLIDLREDNNVKAVVLRVNSPGGSAFASEQIWHEVVKLKAVKPVIVSMGSTAASGGYYISCSADSIFAEASTLTGSIGIFGMIPNMQGLISDKLGLDLDVVKTNLHSDMTLPIRALTESEKAVIQKNVEQGYALFIKRCAEGREMSEEEIRKVAEGRVWTGSMAKELGLVDELGGLEKAVDIAAEKAGVESYSIISYPSESNFLSTLMNEGKEDYINGKMVDALGEYYHYLRFVENVKNMDHIQARMPFELRIR